MPHFYKEPIDRIREIRLSEKMFYQQQINVKKPYICG